ncbi:hypothetical protein RHMOL_Rhmol08G0322200 [Rhododendron molle]|uniref:Uncharacterized protein n=1 Tax=Rhododendron molle TaxID=49168 RepID=A0ACC0MW27_RHOML|nr:hypothetical protein RHMOL_Rhmol08G0322200 [Rhododendron molle]
MAGMENREKFQYENGDDYEDITDEDMAALGKKLSESEEKLWMAIVDLERLFEAEEEIHMLKEWSAFKDEVITETNQEIANRKRKELIAKLKEQNAKLKEQTAKLKEQLAKDEEQLAKDEEQFAKAEEQLAKDKERLANYKASLDEQIARANKEHAKLKEQRMLLNREKAKEDGIGEDEKASQECIQAGPPFLSSEQRTQPGLTVGEAAASSPATPTTPLPVKPPSSP